MSSVNGLFVVVVRHDVSTKGSGADIALGPYATRELAQARIDRTAAGNSRFAIAKIDNEDWNQFQQREVVFNKDGVIIREGVKRSGRDRRGFPQVDLGEYERRSGFDRREN